MQFGCFHSSLKWQHSVRWIQTIEINDLTLESRGSVAVKSNRIEEIFAQARGNFSSILGWLHSQCYFLVSHAELKKKKSIYRKMMITLVRHLLPSLRDKHFNYFKKKKKILRIDKSKE